MNSLKWKSKVILAFIFCGFLFFIFLVSADTNILQDSPPQYLHWAWNDTIGWIDFNYATGNVNVLSSKISGYASSSVGYIAFDCATSPNGNVCGSPATWQVSNDGAGNLSGWAWSDSVGWISFDCHDLDPTCNSGFVYQVTIDSTGDFSGWAWNDTIGWISFNCNNSGASCSPSDYKVKTSWISSTASGTLLSSTFDTGVEGGVAFNSIMWKGSQPCSGGTCSHVEFQFSAADQSSGVGGMGQIDATFKYAWNDSTGWWDFGSNGTVNVTSTQLTGYADNTNLSYISLDCATSPNGYICSPQNGNYTVNRNTSTGDLSGWAWNDTIGWISFNSETDGVASDYAYKVTVDPTTGIFSGWAWNDDVGWISFCGNAATGSIWDGSKWVCPSVPTYYIATNQSGFPVSTGPDCMPNTTYVTSNHDVPIPLTRSCYNNKRYYRYKIFLFSSFDNLVGPRVDDVIVNWSP